MDKLIGKILERIEKKRKKKEVKEKLKKQREWKREPERKGRETSNGNRLDAILSRVLKINDGLSEEKVKEGYVTDPTGKLLEFPPPSPLFPSLFILQSPIRFSNVVNLARIASFLPFSFSLSFLDAIFLVRTHVTRSAVEKTDEIRDMPARTVKMVSHSWYEPTKFPFPVSHAYQTCILPSRNRFVGWIHLYRVYFHCIHVIYLYARLRSSEVKFGLIGKLGTIRHRYD